MLDLIGPCPKLRQILRKVIFYVRQRSDQDAGLWMAGTRTGIRDFSLQCLCLHRFNELVLSLYVVEWEQRPH